MRREMTSLAYKVWDETKELQDEIGFPERTWAEDVSYSHDAIIGRWRPACALVTGEAGDDSSLRNETYQVGCSFYLSARPWPLPWYTNWVLGTKVDFDSNLNLLDVSIKPLTTEDEPSRIESAIRALWNSYTDYFADNWDGYGATSLSYTAIEEATRFIKALPSFCDLPDFVPEPSGEIALEWYRGKKSVFVVSFNGKGLISYAGLFGEGVKTYGTEHLSERLPKIIIENINRVLSSESD
jgi:hypothetical protein